MCISCNQPKGEEDEKSKEAKEKAIETGEWYAISIDGELITAEYSRRANIPVKSYYSPNVLDLTGG